MGAHFGKNGQVPKVEYCKRRSVMLQRPCASTLRIYLRRSGCPFSAYYHCCCCCCCCCASFTCLPQRKNATNGLSRAVDPVLSQVSFPPFRRVQRVRNNYRVLQDLHPHSPHYWGARALLQSFSKTPSSFVEERRV